MPNGLVKGLVSLLPGVLDTLGGITGLDVLKKAADALKGVPPEKRLELELAIMQHERELRSLALAEMQTEIQAKVDLMKAELAQEDKYVSRARPTGLYISYLVSLGLAAAVIAGVRIDTAAILTLLGPLMGFSGWYAYNRTREKLNGNNTQFNQTHRMV